jgi:hypothetical protein
MPYQEKRFTEKGKLAVLHILILTAKMPGTIKSFPDVRHESRREISALPKNDIQLTRQDNWEKVVYPHDSTIQLIAHIGFCPFSYLCPLSKQVQEPVMANRYKEFKGLNLPAIEKEVLARWEAENAFQKSVEIREGAEPCVFYEGPPSANGMPGIHHVISRTLKDLVCRYKTMQGFKV